jgi:flagellar assembly protein FliH
MEALIKSAAMAEGSVRLPGRTTAVPAAAAPVAAATPVQKVSPSSVAATPAPTSAPSPAPTAPPPTPEEISVLRKQLEDAFAQRRKALEAEQEAAKTEFEAEKEALRVEAESRGHAKGLARGEEEARSALELQVSRCAQLATQLAKCRAQLVEEGEDMLVEVAFAAITRLLGEQAASANGVRAAVQAAIAAANDSEALTISLHPDDLELLAGHAGFEQERLRLVADLNISLGGCTVEGAKGTLDARLDMQLDRLRACLLEVRAERSRAGEAV